MTLVTRELEQCYLTAFFGGNLNLITIATRSFSDIERQYSTSDKEASDLVYVVCGRRLTLIKDHMPLDRVFSENC